ncbi:MAG: PilZ domain-containing protein [Sedimentisphaerales bacterium]|nr:PilZ domain-containing protein [Sedimentisphaerales bacterium]
MERNERRKTRRLGARFDLSYHEVGSPAYRAYIGSTLNVSTGGLYFETQDRQIKPGSLLEVDLSIPPERGVLEFGGKISGFAKVLRTDIIADEHSTDMRRGIAVRFCRTPALRL